MRRTAISLFSSGGIGDLGLSSNGLDIVLSNEKDEVRHALYKRNFPKVRCFEGDIWKYKNAIIHAYRRVCPSTELFLLYATPPCQGMSSNGAGRLLYEARSGKRAGEDERNRLIIPTMDIAVQLKPRWVLFENVPRMRMTSITDEGGRVVNILSYIERRLGPEYHGGAEVVACEDYGIPQIRKRLITIFTRDVAGREYYCRNGSTFFPKDERLQKKTLRQAIGHTPALDARPGFESREDFHPLHFVPVMKEDKYWWISNTPEGNTAYNNQCVNPSCRHSGNPLHRDVKCDGRWTSSRETPIYCVKCGELLPRPAIRDRQTKEMRLIKGFHSAYRRMKWDEPGTTLTQNLLYEASDNKVHPEQNRVLSLYEAMILQTVSEYNYNFEIGGKLAPRTLVAELLGESVPPKLIEVICRKMLRLSGQASTMVSRGAKASRRPSGSGRRRL